MAIEDIPGTAEYLTNAAHLLRLTAPGTSAHLMSHRNQLLYEHKASQTDIQQQRACGGCGNIHIPPINWKTIKHEPGKSLQKPTRAFAMSSRLGLSVPNSKPSVTTESYRLLRCDRCKRETKIALGPPGHAVRLKAKMPAKVKKPVAPEALKPTANATSKKRAKNRKAGLQALLSGQQKQASNPLSLANFMK
ncbi:hypothetical protein B0T10DRAFT_462109 [Thelonectria olida]|uniref:Uncharacterized protein n=1 Tax=Thelonectria olida TaxID=1576542 RepID=A0A9P8VZ96_9HYPO|nr:hypothetical protein B0T10DRAFT_462109 [Thelonectria olida]